MDSGAMATMGPANIAAAADDASKLQDSKTVLSSKTTNLWDEALERLTEQEKCDLDLVSGDKLDILQDVLRAVDEKKELCLQRRWKFRRANGDVVIVRDVLGKLIRWVKKFQEVGDAAIQYDPGHAALPWAAVRFVLQIAVNDSQTFGAMIEGIEFVSSLIARYAIFEGLYLRTISPAGDETAKSIVKLYAAMLKYLSSAKRYYSQPTSKRMIKSMIQSTDDAVDVHIATIREAQIDVEACARLADAENQRIADAGVQNLQKTIDSLSADYSQKLRDILHDLERPIDRIHEQLSHLQTNLDKTERRNCLQWMSTVPYLTHHKTMFKNCLPMSGDWLFRRSDFLDWEQSSVSAIIWLHGIPGSGKSKLVSILVEQLKNRKILGQQAAPFAYFFCARSAAEKHRAEPVEVLRCIVKQLSCSGPELTIWQPTLKMYHEKQEQAEEEGCEPNKLSVEECVVLIIEFAERNPITIIIDALDECNASNRHELLTALEMIIRDSLSLVKVFVSSRDDNDIVCRLSDTPNVYIHAKDNKEDIERFVQNEVTQSIEQKRLLGGKVPDQLEQRIIEALIQGAQGMFRWVSLQIQNLCDSQRIMLVDDVIAELGQLPKTLYDLHALAYNRISDSGPSSRSLAERSLKWLLCANRPLQIAEFLGAVSVDSQGNSLDVSLRDVLNVCSNMVVFDAELDIFRFAHLSVREYLESREDYEMIGLNDLIADRCIGSYVGSKQKSSHRKQQDEAMKPYATLYWPVHYKAAENYLGASLIELARLFLFDAGSVAPCFEKWMEDMRKIARSLDWANTLRQMLNASSSPRTSPLFVCCSFGLLSLAQDLDRLHHITWDQLNDAENTGLHIAAEYGHLDIVSLLLDKGVDVNAEGYYKNTALHRAATAGHVSIGKFLLKRGADIQAESSDGKTALHRAADRGHEEFVRMLLKKGAYIEAKHIHGKTALYRAAENGHHAVVDCLLKNWANANTSSNDGNRPLHIAAQYGYDRIISLLLEADGWGTNVNEKNYAQRTPLYLAVRAEHETIVQMLLADKADVEVIGPYGETALHGAARSGNETIVRLLLEKGADPNTKASHGETAHDCAIRLGYDKIAQLLKEYQVIENAVETWSNVMTLNASEQQQNDGNPADHVGPSENVEGSTGDQSKKSYGPDDFKLIKLVGKGVFGQVYQVREKASRRMYAMKVLHKKTVVKEKKIAHALGQRDVLLRTAVTESPFIARLRFSFQTADHLYILTDFLSGGELFWHLQKEGRFPEQRAKFYLAELVLVIQHLHEHDINIGYLRPENILLDTEGHVVFNDFSLSMIIPGKREQGQEEGIDYMAPEIINEEATYNSMSDFWSLGILAFEMICGWSPFYSEDHDQLLKNIAFGKVRFPRDTLGREGRDFIKRLLNRKLENRLGATNGAQEVKAHVFFSDIDWPAMASKTIVPPPMATLQSATTNLEVEEPPKSLIPSAQSLGYSLHSAPLSSTMQANFKGFTFVDEEPLSKHFKFVDEELHNDDWTQQYPREDDE